MRNILSSIISISHTLAMVIRDRIAIKLAEAQAQAIKSMMVAAHVVQAEEASKHWRWDEAIEHLKIAEHIKKTW